MTDLQKLARDITDSALRMNNDVNGNPRYYLPCFCFCDESGNMYRPAYAAKYRGKQYGAGWVFQSYSLERDILRALSERIAA